MKKLWMVTTVALVAVTIALLTMAYKPGVNEPKQILTVKVHVHVSPYYTSNILITYPNGYTEKKEIELKKNSGGFERIEQASPQVIDILNRVSSEGYSMISSSAGDGPNSIFEVYVFEK